MTYVSEYKVWFKPKPTRSEPLERLIEIARNKYNHYQTLMKSKCDTLSEVALMQSYIDDNPHIQKTSAREARYGEYYMMSVCHHVGMASLIKTIKEFIYEVTYGYSDLPYVVIYRKMKNSYRIHIWIADRQWVNKIKVYDRDYWYDATTGKASTSKRENAILKCTKGEPKLNEDGQPILITWAQKKTLIFNESYADSQKRNYDAIESILIRIKNTIKNMFSFHKRTGKKAIRLYIKNGEHRDKQHVYREISSLQYYLQQACYKAILEAFDYKAWDDDINRGISDRMLDISEPYGEIARKLVKLYYKYRNRIKKGSFHDRSGEELHLFKKVSYKQGLVNAQKLRVEFKHDLNSLTGGK